MRKQTLSEGLSTIEALAEALRRLGHIDAAETLQDAFEREAERWQVLRRQD
jgi:DTW domain-containing protein YfiP